MPWDWQQAHALRAMATLRARLPATRHTAHLAARPDRAHAHVQRGTAVQTVLQVPTASPLVLGARKCMHHAQQGMHDCMCIVTCLGIGSKPMHCGRWQHCGHDCLRLDTRHTWRHDRIVHMHMCSGVQRCRLCYYINCLHTTNCSWLRLLKCSGGIPVCS